MAAWNNDTSSIGAIRVSAMQITEVLIRQTLGFEISFTLTTPQPTASPTARPISAPTARSAIASGSVEGVGSSTG